jgi:hypothetical protein
VLGFLTENLLRFPARWQARIESRLREILRQKEALPSHVTDSLKLFWRVRNQLVHGRTASDDDILRAIDSGNTILKAIRSIPHWVKVVQNPGVEIFEDPNLATRSKGQEG